MIVFLGKTALDRRCWHPEVMSRRANRDLCLFLVKSYKVHVATAPYSHFRILASFPRNSDYRDSRDRNTESSQPTLHPSPSAKPCPSLPSSISSLSRACCCRQ